LACLPKFSMTTLESLNTKIIANILSFLLDKSWTLIRLHPMNGSGQIGQWSETSGLGYKMDQDQCGLNTNFVANSLIFSIPTHTHESGNHSDIYGHPKAAIVRSFSGTAGNRFPSNRLETQNGFRLQWRLQVLCLLVSYLIRVIL
jgi:hypothetical protein